MEVLKNTGTVERGLMEISLINVLLNNISSFLYLSSHDNVAHEPALKYYRKAEQILKLLKPVLDAVFYSDISSEELLQKAFADLGDAVIELKELFGNFHPLTSKIYFVLQFETSILKIQASILEIFKHLKSFAQHLPLELNASSLEKIKQIGVEQTSTIISQAIREQVEGSRPSSESLAKLEDRLSLKSNQELLIEAVALEKFKEHAEQAEENSEAEYFNQMIALVTLMHKGLVAIEQSESSNPVPVPAEFCCPLSLKLMTDPVIVASGQTYERDFIKKWIDLGLTVCPKTRQTLVHSHLIPNYTVKALIANLRETNNNAKLADPMKSISFNHPSSIANAENIAFKDVHIHSRNGKPISPESTRNSGSPGNNLVSSSGMHSEGTSSLQPLCSFVGSLHVIAANGADLSGV